MNNNDFKLFLGFLRQKVHRAIMGKKSHRGVKTLRLYSAHYFLVLKHRYLELVTVNKKAKGM